MPRSSTSRLAPDPQFDARLQAVRVAAPVVADPALLDGMIKSVVASLSGDISLADLQLYREVEALADYIKNVRRDIAELRPDDISAHHIPMATDELDAVVNATADATGIILGGMEEIERLAAGLPPEIAAPLGDIVIRVYEACGFQDITGQRISKVVKALRHNRRQDRRAARRVRRRSQRRGGRRRAGARGRSAPAQRPGASQRRGEQPGRYRRVAGELRLMADRRHFLPGFLRSLSTASILLLLAASALATEKVGAEKVGIETGRHEGSAASSWPGPAR